MISYARVDLQPEVVHMPLRGRLKGVYVCVRGRVCEGVCEGVCEAV